MFQKKYIFLKLIFLLSSSFLYSQEINEEIIITGSLIKEVQTKNPVFSSSKEDLNKSGYFRVEDYLNFLPIINPGNSSLHSNFSSGTSSVSIRGLGGDRSLILVDGMRLPSGSPLDGNASQDLNQVPDVLIKKIEVLTGGKSTIYGSDATGGVINFILDNDFTGTKFSTHQGAYYHSNNSYLREINDDAKSSVIDGVNSTYSLIVGDNIKKNTHLIGFFEYKNIDSVRWDKRDIGVCAFRGNSSCRLSSATYRARIQNGSKGGFVSSQGFSSTSLGFNFGAANFLQRPDKKINSGFILKKKFLNDQNLKITYFSLSQESNAQIGAPLLFRQKILIPCTNPYLSTDQFEDIGCINSSDVIDGVVSKRFTENSLNRSQFFKTGSNRGLIQIDGKMGSKWDYKISLQNSHTSVRYKYFNDISLSKVKNALNINSLGNCVSNEADCVPLNLFTTNNEIATNVSNGITKEALEYIHLDLSIYGELSENIFSATIDKETMIKSNFIKSLSLLIGVERRENKLIKLPDTNFLNEDGAGQQTQHQNMFGNVSVNDAFLQLGIKFENALNIDSSIRFSDYSFNKDAFTYDFGFFYPITNFLSVKASHQKSIRIADIQELFEPEEVELVYATDPCSGSNPEFSQAQCVFTGLDSNLYNLVDDSSAQLYSKSSGNLNLDPEESISDSISLIAKLKNLRFEVDYFQIKMKDQISKLSISTVINNCILSKSTSSYWCELINRTNDGSLSTSGSFVSTPLFNLSRFETTGVDFKIFQNIDTSLGQISIKNFTNLILKKDFQQDVNSTKINCKSLYRVGDEAGLCYQPSPKIQNILNISLSKVLFDNPSEIGFTIRYIDSIDDSQKIGTSLNIPFDSYSYLDLSFSSKLGNNFDLYMGINNFLDEDPPINGYIGYVPGNANTYPAFYDSLGRFLYLKLSKKIN